MNNFYTKLQVLLMNRLEWLAKRTEVISGNIAGADVRHTKRKELRAFLDVMKSQKSSPTLNMNLSQRDIITTKMEISRDMEILEMAHNTAEHDGVIHLMKSYHRMMRSVIGKQGG